MNKMKSFITLWFSLLLSAQAPWKCSKINDRTHLCELGERTLTIFMDCSDKLSIDFEETLKIAVRKAFQDGNRLFRQAH